MLGWSYSGVLLYWFWYMSIIANLGDSIKAAVFRRFSLFHLCVETYLAKIVI